MVENLNLNFRTMSVDELANLAKAHHWNRIWSLALTIRLLRKLDKPLEDKELEYNFPKHFSLSDIVNQILSEPKIYVFSDFLDGRVRTKAQLNLVHSGIALFIDRLDQALEDLLKNEHYDNRLNENGVSYAFLAWKHAQFALLETCYNINSINPHIKLYATTRIEALDVEAALRPNILGFTTELKYSKEELKTIFINNIKNTPHSKLIEPIKKDKHFQSFFGFEQMPHPRAKDRNHQPRMEHVFDFICRHSYERPRDIVALGKRYYDDVLRANEAYRDWSDEKKIGEVRVTINKEAFEQQYKNYMNEIYDFKQDYLNQMIAAAKQNILTIDELSDIPKEATNYLYRLGLIGYAQNGKQHFLPVSEFVYNTEKTLPKANHYFFHPSIDRQLQANINYEEFYNNHCIIGNGYDFYGSNQFVGQPWKDRGFDYVKPLQVPSREGDGMELSDKFQGISPSLNELYAAFFKESPKEEKVMFDFKNKIFETARQWLSASANRHFNNQLLKKNITPFKANDSKQKQEQWEGVMKSLQNEPYNGQVKSTDKESLQNFGYRLAFRLFTLGNLLLIGIDALVIHALLSGATDQFGCDTAVKFLRKHFFIGKLPSDCRIKCHVESHGKETISEKYKKMFDCLSPYEKDCLRQWWSEYTSFDLPVSFNDDSKCLNELKPFVERNNWILEMN